jgi:hypothetical protein
MSSYASILNGQNLLSPSLQAAVVSVTTLPAAASSSLLSTCVDETVGRNVTILETITYRVIVTVPEGTTSGASVQCVFPNGGILSYKIV